MNIAEGLRKRAAEGRPVRIGLIGAGEMGTDIVTQVALMQGIRIAVLAARRPERALAAFAIAGTPGAGQICEDMRAVERVVAAGRTAIVPELAMACESDMVDVVIDATGSPNAGAQVARRSIAAGKHMVMMNVEADVTIGAWLRDAADRAGVVYTLGAGDEPSAAMELIEFVQGLGYPVIAAGKGKNNPFRIDATPDAYRAEAERRNMNPRMLVEFVDGSKTMIEMTAIANATGLVPDCPGMHGPAATLTDLEKVLCPREDGGVLSRKGVVDYSIGKGVAPGVFVIAEMAHPRVRERMHDLKLGPGPYYTFYRPYHLTSLEVPLSCARAVLYHAADMQPLDVPSAEVCAVAKKDLTPGERLDAIGEYTYRAWIMTVEDAQQGKAIPCGLLEGGKAVKPIRKGELLTYENCAVDAGSRIVALRKRQDDMLKGTVG